MHAALWQQLWPAALAGPGARCPTCVADLQHLACWPAVAVCQFKHLGLQPGGGHRTRLWAHRTRLVWQGVPGQRAEAAATAAAAAAGCCHLYACAQQLAQPHAAPQLLPLLHRILLGQQDGAGGHRLRILHVCQVAAAAAGGAGGRACSLGGHVSGWQGSRPQQRHRRGQPRALERRRAPASGLPSRLRLAAASTGCLSTH